jgi:hypothetical protein
MTADVKRFLSHCRDARVRARHAAVLYPLADECRPGRGALCEVSYQRVAAAARMDRRSAIRIIAELSAMTGEGYETGLIGVVSRRRPLSAKAATNVYDLTRLVDLGRRWEAEDALARAPIEADEPEAEGLFDGYNLSPTEALDGDTLSPTEAPVGGNLTPTDALAPKVMGDFVTNIGDTGTTNIGDTGVTPTDVNTTTTTTGDGGGGGVVSGGEGTAEEPAEEQGPPRFTGEYLERLGVSTESVLRILSRVPQERIESTVRDYERAVADGANIGPGLLVSALLDGKVIGPARTKRATAAGAPRGRPYRCALYECEECHEERVKTSTTLGGEWFPVEACYACGGRARFVRELRSDEVEVLQHAQMMRP